MEMLNNCRGASLIMAILMLVVVSVLGAMMASTFRSHTMAVADHLSATRALFVAEGGLERGIRKYREDCANYAGETNIPLGVGTFTTELYQTDFTGDVLDDSRRRIRSTGTAASAVRAVEQVVSCTALFPLVILAQNSIVLANNADVFCGPGLSNPCSQAQIDLGNCPCARENATMSPAPPVPNPAPPQPPGGCTLSNNQVRTWPEGTYYCPSGLVLANNAQIILSGAVTFYSTFITLANNSLFNTGGPSSALFVIARGAITFANNSRLNGALYAPGQQVTLANNARLTGTAACRNATLANNAEVVYDFSAGDTSALYGQLYEGRISWREVPPS
jgi:hypothetical protein